MNSTLISREIIEKELSVFNDEMQLEVTELDRKHLAAFKSFIRFNVLKQKKSLVLEDYVFSALGKHLCENPTISYESFKIISSMAPEKARKYFSPKNFLLFPKDANQSIESDDFVRYIERSIEIENTILTLMEFVAIGDPYCTSITEQQLNSYLFRLIPEIDIGSKMHDTFYEYYVYTASQKFMFFLDPRNANVLPIKKLAHSPVMEELLFLRRLSNNYHTQLDAEYREGDEGATDLLVELSMEFDSHANSNWFSGHNAVKIYSLFLELDKDQNGMLSAEELRQYTGFSGADQIQFTATAVSRLFEEYVSYQPVEMDYKAFVNLVLATENLTSPESQRYFFRAIDCDHSGRLSADKIRFFYKDIRDSLVATNYDAPSAEHVVLEIFDLVACNDARGPSLGDLVASKQGHTVMTMLLDVNGFWKYDNRETLMAQQNHEEEGEPVALQLPPKAQQKTSQQQRVLSQLEPETYDDEGFESYDD